MLVSKNNNYNTQLKIYINGVPDIKIPQSEADCIVTVLELRISKYFLQKDKTIDDLQEHVIYLSL